MSPSRIEAPVTAIRARAYKIPTDAPEADGTKSWDSTTLVVVEMDAGGRTGLGYTYSGASITGLITGDLAKAVKGVSALSPPRAWAEMQRAVRNLGRDGLASTAISAIDAALWDLKGKLLDMPLVLLLGQLREAVPIYGSGGFTTYSDGEMREQLSGWVERDGCRWVKIKIGSHPEDDPRRIALARSIIGKHGLFIDANGAFTPKQALHLAETVRDQGVSWFEEPVSSDDLPGLRLLKERMPAEVEVAAGEYAYSLDYVRAMLQADAVDVQQTDASRIGGITGFMRSATLCDAFHTDLSGHCAPALHLHAACAAPRLRHLEWFHDHVRIEAMLFDGAPVAKEGAIRPDLSRPGLGLEFRTADADQYLVQ
ncbi:enolase C-terminal domain-like protein [Faunimonas pinastri]|nr:enolase C-terminal domain-like protein [Faunimonas pinastri]